MTKHFWFGGFVRVILTAMVIGGGIGLAGCVPREADLRKMHGQTMVLHLHEYNWEEDAKALDFWHGEGAVCARGAGCYGPDCCTLPTISYGDGQSEIPQCEVWLTPWEIDFTKIWQVCARHASEAGT